jgi:hypothetical protein
MQATIPIGQQNQFGTPINLIRPNFEANLFMNKLICVTAVFLIWGEIDTKALVGYILDPPNIPENLFENSSNGIAVALELKSRSGQDGKRRVVEVYIRNTSGSDRYFFQHPAFARLEIYYISDSGAAVPLRKYRYNDTISGDSTPTVLKSGHTLSREIVLNENEWKICQSHSVIFKCNIFGPSSRLIKVVSSPKILTEE